jgi:hypothetical protein
MLADLIVKELARRWRALDLTVQEAIKELATLTLTEIQARDKPPVHQLPTPRPAL